MPTCPSKLYSGQVFQQLSWLVLPSPVQVTSLALLWLTEAPRLSGLAKSFTHMSAAIHPTTDCSFPERRTTVHLLFYLQLLAWCLAHTESTVEPTYMFRTATYPQALRHVPVAGGKSLLSWQTQRMANSPDPQYLFFTYFIPLYLGTFCQISIEYLSLDFNMFKNPMWVKVNHKKLMIFFCYCYLEVNPNT